MKDMLAPKAIQDVVGMLKEKILFSIQTDASNKGNRKIFPVAVQLFTPERCVENKMIDFENADE